MKIIKLITMKNHYLASVIFISMLLTSCAVEVKTVFNHKTDFKKFKTYCWMEGCGVTSKDSVVRKLQRILESDLKRKGLVQAASNPDLLIAARLTLKDEHTMIYRRQDEMPMTWASPTEAQAIDYTRGTIVVAMADAQLGNLVWESVAVEFLSNQNEANDKNLQKGVRRLLVNYPPDTELKARRNNAVY